jgi:DNA polymerase III gamma/tau subunit
MSNQNPEKSSKSCPDILRWQPSRWELFLGNNKIIKYFKRLVGQIRSDMQVGGNQIFNHPSFLLFGPSRSGKTALVKFFLRCVNCKMINYATLDPCDGSCSTCRDKPELFGQEGLFSIIAADSHQIPIQTGIVDCAMIQTPAELRDKMSSFSYFNGISILYFDEVHRLVKRNMDEMLLKSVEDRSNLWIFSTANPRELDDMFLNRLLKFETEFPTEKELESWLVCRCKEWGIMCERDAICRVVQKSNLVVGKALHALALASLDSKNGLNMDLVENEWISNLD